MLEQRGSWFRVIFRFNGKRYAQTLNTTNPRTANSLKGGIEKTLLLLEQRVLKVPDAVDPLTFIMAGGELPPPTPEPKAEERPAEAKPEAKPKFAGVRTLKQLCERYTQTLALSVEENSLATVEMHLRHVKRFFGVDFDPNDIAPGRLQEYVEHRARRKGIRKRPLSAYTIRKELTTFRAAWNWAKQMLLIEPAFPDTPLKFPKMREKQPFQTFAEIERRIAAGLTDTEKKELWDCLFLGVGEINELLEHVKATAQQPFVYPLFCFAAHTGTRRSEMLRLKKSDIDLSSNVALIHEKKRVRGTTTTRRVALSPFLKKCLANGSHRIRAARFFSHSRLPSFEVTNAERRRRPLRAAKQRIISCGRSKEANGPSSAAGTYSGIRSRRTVPQPESTSGSSTNGSATRPKKCDAATGIAFRASKKRQSRPCSAPNRRLAEPSQVVLWRDHAESLRRNRIEARPRYLPARARRHLVTRATMRSPWHPTLRLLGRRERRRRSVHPGVVPRRQVQRSHDRPRPTGSRNWPDPAQRLETFARSLTLRKDFPCVANSTKGGSSARWRLPYATTPHALTCSWTPRAGPASKS
jgi:integrase